MSVEEKEFNITVKKDVNNASEETEAGPLMNKGDDESESDQIVTVIGNTGRWQLEKLLLVYLVSIPGVAHIFVSSFIFPKTDFWCEEELATNSTIADVPVNLKNNCSLVCSKFSFDKSFWDETVLSEWELVCGSSYLPVLAKIIFYSGFGVGTFLAGLVSDVWGRKISILLFSLLTLISGMVTSFMPSFSSFTIMWWLVGVSAIASFTVAFVWSVELATGKWKVVYGVGMMFTWPVGRGLAVLAASTFPNWRTIFQFVSAPCIMVLVLIYFIPESPRWLIAKGRLDDARDILTAAAKRNNRQITEKQIELQQPNISPERNGNTCDIMRYSKLRIKTFIMIVNWFSTSFLSYGISLNWQDLTGELFLNFLVDTILVFPANFLALMLLLRFGRRLPYILLTLLAGVCFVGCLFLQNTSKLPVIILSMLGSFCVSITFTLLWIWTSELMPTTVRNAGVGACSFAARIGVIIATTLGVLADVSPLIPPALFASWALISAALSLFLPETKGSPLPDSPEESEKIPLQTLKQAVALKVKRKTEDPK